MDKTTKRVSLDLDLETYEKLQYIKVKTAKTRAAILRDLINQYFLYQAKNSIKK